MSRNYSSFILLFVLTLFNINHTHAARVTYLYERDIESFYQFHQHLLDLLLEIEGNQKMREPQSVEFEKVLNSFKSFLINSAHADEGREVCIYGGWPSFKDRNGRCNAPWNYSQSSRLMSYGPTYTTQHFCGGNNLFRCAPILFGPGETGLGHCIEYSSSSQITQKCYDQGKVHMATVLHLYQYDPEFRSQYQRNSALIIEFCRENPNYGACEYLLQNTTSVSNLNCEDCYEKQLKSENELDGLEASIARVDQELQNQDESLNQTTAPTQTTPIADQRIERTNQGGLGTPVLTQTQQETPHADSNPVTYQNNQGQSTIVPPMPVQRPASLGGPSSSTPVSIPDIDYTVSDEEAEDLIRRNRLETNEDVYNQLKDIARSTHRSSGQRACQNALNQAYQNISPEPLWANLSLSERAEEVRKVANYTYGKIQETGTPGTARGNPNQIHPLLSPAIGVCIPFIEVRGTLNPHALNYTFCSNNNSSTAHGIGQQTRTTFVNLRNQNLLPLTVAPDYNHLEPRQLFHKLNTDVILQMEVLLRYMNVELKQKCRRDNCTQEDLMAAVAQYDQDQQSSYMRKFKTCYDCVQGLGADGDVMNCYNAMD